MPTQSVTVLSVQQPFASLILSGLKIVENRSWTTPYRGTLYIHASGKPCTDADLVAYGHEDDIDKLPGRRNGKLQTGLILGTVQLVGCVYEPSRSGPGRYERVHNAIYKALDDAAVEYDDSGIDVDITQECWWLLANPQLLDQPIPAKGKLRLWTFSA